MPVHGEPGWLASAVSLQEVTLIMRLTAFLGRGGISLRSTERKRQRPRNVIPAFQM